MVERTMFGLSKQDVMVIVNRWIGVKDGYLGDFKYRTHEEFYPEYCGVDYDPNDFEGTTRQKFISILSAAPPADQAKIVRGVLERFPIEAEGAPPTRNAELRSRLVGLADGIERQGGIASPSPKVSSEAVRRALSDSETLLGTAEAGNVVDRVHTAFHGYLLAVCEDEGLTIEKDSSVTQLFKTLRTRHPRIRTGGPRSQDISKILGAMATIIDSLQPLRNRASLAHPNPHILADPEALLVINSIRTVFHYLDQRLSE